MTDIELENLAEGTRNEINKVAFLCSGEEECHTFDVGFITGYKKASKEIDIHHNILPPSLPPKPLTCLEYALTFWDKNRDYKIYYNSDHIINLKEGTIPPKGYLELKEFGLNHTLASFYYDYTFAEIIYINLIKKYFKNNV